jgi:3-oxoacyl-[acyl-carrier-protein] synthase-3
MYGSKIIGTGSYAPQGVRSNYDLEQIVDTDDEWIITRTGIKERRIVPEGMVTSDMAVVAAKQAMAEAKISAEDLDLIICATTTPDMTFPSTACFVQDKLGAYQAAAFDVVAVCSGFLYALSIADQFLRSRAYERILVIGAECLSKITDLTDRGTCILFGDGAGAVVMEATSGESRVLSTHLFANGSYWELLQMPGGGSKNPASYASVDQRMHYIKMNGNETFKVAVRALEQACRQALLKNNVATEEVKIFIPHQANLRIIQAVAGRLKFPMEKVFVNIHKYGNTSAASVPLALNEARRQGLIERGDLVLLAAFGGGFVWGSALIRW